PSSICPAFRFWWAGHSSSRGEPSSRSGNLYDRLFPDGWTDGSLGADLRRTFPHFGGPERIHPGLQRAQPLPELLDLVRTHAVDEAGDDPPAAHDQRLDDAHIVAGRCDVV